MAWRNLINSHQRNMFCEIVFWNLASRFCEDYFKISTPWWPYLFWPSMICRNLTEQRYCWEIILKSGQCFLRRFSKIFLVTAMGIIFFKEKKQRIITLKFGLSLPKTRCCLKKQRQVQIFRRRQATDSHQSQQPNIKHFVLRWADAHKWS